MRLETDPRRHWTARPWRAIGPGIRHSAVSGKTAWDAIETARHELFVLTHGSDSEIELLARAFQRLAAHSAALFGLASDIVERVESEAVASILPGVQALSRAAILFVETRQMAAREILEKARAEMMVLQQLSKLARSQSAIALKTRVLTMMTNVEVGRLGAATGFECLADELGNFSRMLTAGTDDLECHTEARRFAIEETNRMLRSELPHLAEELGGIRASLGDDLTVLEGDLARLGSIPARFKACVQEIATQTSGVVAAIQSYDITRQQIQHVQEAMGQIADAVRRGGTRRKESVLSRAAMGISIQIFQLRYIRRSIASWISQIRCCMEVMLTASTSDLAEIGPIVSECQAEISARLIHIELLQNESKSCSERMRHAERKYTGLVQLIDEQVKKATVARQTLHLLSLNAIVEASRLGTAANAVLEIGSGISDLSLECGIVTDQSERAMQQISRLVGQSDDLFRAFSNAEDTQLRACQLQTRQGLESLRETSELTANRARDIAFGLEKMRAISNDIARGVDALDRSNTRIDGVLDRLESVKSQLHAEGASDREDVDADEARHYFSASYSTEAEREVLDAVLGGTELPSIRPAEGNGVELF